MVFDCREVGNYSVGNYVLEILPDVGNLRAWFVQQKDTRDFLFNRIIEHCVRSERMRIHENYGGGMMKIHHLGSIWHRPLSVELVALDSIRDGRCVSMGFVKFRQISPKFAEIRRNCPALARNSPEIRPKFDRNSPKTGGIRRISPKFAETVRAACTTRRNSYEIQPKFAETFFDSTEIRRNSPKRFSIRPKFAEIRRNSPNRVHVGRGRHGISPKFDEIRRNSPKREKHGLRFAEIRTKFDRNGFEFDRNSTEIRRNGN